MSPGPKRVREYLEDLGKTKEGREPQVKEGLEAYIELWKRAIERGVVGAEDEVDEALGKLEEAGGLYKAAEG